MDWQNFWHWLYVAGMAIGAIYFISLGRNPRGLPRLEYFVATFIPIWSGLAYMSMALPGIGIEQGRYVAFEGHTVFFARYLDWVVTTPLLLLALSWTAMHYQSKKDWTLIFSLMATQVIVILSGLIADLSAVPWVRYLWYINGTVAFLIILWGIWGPLRAKTKGYEEHGLPRFYDRLTTFFTATWICYPIIWIIGHSGLNLINQTTEVFLFCLVPFFSKVVFSYLDLNGLRSLGSREAETGPERFVSGTFYALENIMAFWKPQRKSSRRRVRYLSEGMK
ncbi:rhodopsin [Chlorogloeopsis fritschii PCC 6912]|uniref:Rhodopsin n=1 Tax=Chlorogloeopsis fritschii PCC 6912 TaxID=211165 RepID=A0A433NPX7_CHLFR|nr:bacteriorhodopsin [Chlorogloeopsis fritschii]MBF2008306.1 bacteriorhodopsin [Chlorogloeopsis fritschii C42_A2020_084]RUR85891.1 rhodopsin [Chlorogloeopsis fritschii PCC 6912]